MLSHNVLTDTTIKQQTKQFHWEISCNLKLYRIQCFLLKLYIIWFFLVQYCNTKTLAYSFTLWVDNTLVHGSLNDEAAPISRAQTSSKIKTRTKTACPIQTSTILQSKPVRPPVSNADSSVIMVDYNPDSVFIHRLNPSNQHKADILHIWSWSNERLGARFTAVQ